MRVRRPRIDAHDARRGYFRTYVGKRGVLEAAADMVAWTVGLAVGCLERFDFRVSQIHVRELVFFALGAAVLQTVVGAAAGLYLGRWRVGSLEEAGAIAANVAVVAGLLLVSDAMFRAHPVPLSSVMGGGFCALIVIGGSRTALRLTLERHQRRASAGTVRLLVFGAGEGGTQVIDAILRDRRCPYLPVALLDDAPSKRTLRIRGVHVEGGRDALPILASHYKAEALLIAIPSANRETVAELTALGQAAGLAVKVLPAVSELFGTLIDALDIRDVSEEDLLGRTMVDTDVASIAGYLTGKRVLVTGAGGSIGSELCRHIARFEPSELVMLDRDESGLHAVQLSLEGRALLDSPAVVLLDIRDRQAVFDCFRACQPEVVFHAAALKHLPLLEQYPGEAIQTNIGGTVNVLDVAIQTGVERFVNISTDKAADPISVLGAIKRIGERLTAHAATEASGIFLSVRFGNVLGSRGSVATTFRAQMEAGGPITVTDPDVTRYFMTAAEAVELVIQAGAIGRSGEVLVLDMGEPVRIADMAARFASRASQPVEIVFTGLREGEKLHEVLLAADESDERPFHPLISHITAPPLEPSFVQALDCRAPKGECRRELLRVCNLRDARQPLTEIA